MSSDSVRDHLVRWLCFSLISGVDASEQYLLDFQFPFMTDMYKLLPQLVESYCLSFTLATWLLVSVLPVCYVFSFVCLIRPESKPLSI